MIPLHKTVPTVTEMRAILSRSRRRVRDDTNAAIRDLAAVDPDPDVLDIVQEPFASIEDTYERLVRLEEYFRERDDRRSVFLTVYTRMTATVRDHIQSGFFADSAWVREYLVTFANYYRRALIAFERRDFEAVPVPWQIAFVTSLQGGTLVAQDALLGINAHITYDLTYALQEVSIDPDREAKRGDHDRINHVLEQLVDVVQETLVSVYAAAGVSQVDAILGPLDEQFALLGLTQSRLFAWRNAVLLTDLSWRPVQAYVHWRVRTVSTGAAAVVVSPSLDATTRERLRSVEADLEPLSAFHEEFLRQCSGFDFDLP